jgi:hypothetical protein
LRKALIDTRIGNESGDICVGGTLVHVGMSELFDGSNESYSRSSDEYGSLLLLGAVTGGFVVLISMSYWLGISVEVHFVTPSREDCPLLF